MKLFFYLLYLLIYEDYFIKLHLHKHSDSEILTAKKNRRFLEKKYIFYFFAKNQFFKGYKISKIILLQR